MAECWNCGLEIPAGKMQRVWVRTKVAEGPMGGQTVPFWFAKRDYKELVPVCPGCAETVQKSQEEVEKISPFGTGFISEILGLAIVLIFITILLACASAFFLPSSK